KIALAVLLICLSLFTNLILKDDPFDDSVLIEDEDIYLKNIKYVTVPTYHDNVKLQTIEMGRKDKPLILFLHGFPETALISWHHQLQFFDEQYSDQYHILAPDMRGYNHSDKPETVNEYHLSYLVSDVHAIIHKYAGKKEAYIVAHDWGGIVAWAFARQFPDSVTKLIVLNGPDVPQEAKALPSWDQIKKSWYIELFQLPTPLPEIRFSKNNFETLKKLYVSWNSGQVTKPVMKRLLQAWDEPGHLRANINWYRSLLQGSIRQLLSPDPEITKWKVNKTHVMRPTLLLWGVQDVCMVPETANLSFESVHESVRGESDIVEYHDSGHFVQHEKYAEVNQQIINFLKY
ncbi:yfhM, partial [Acrasis kona]